MTVNWYAIKLNGVARSMFIVPWSRCNRSLTPLLLNERSQKQRATDQHLAHNEIGGIKPVKLRGQTKNKRVISNHKQTFRNF